VSDRAVLAGIVFVLTTGISWNDLPQELGFGSGVTCWRRLREWQRIGLWERLHRLVLDRLGQQGLLDWSRAAVDSVSVRAKRKGELTGPNPTDRGKPGTMYHVLCDRNGLPLHVLATGANTHDSTMLAPLLDTNPGVRKHGNRPGSTSPGRPPGRRPGGIMPTERVNLPVACAAPGRSVLSAGVSSESPWHGWAPSRRPRRSFRRWPAHLRAVPPAAAGTIFTAPRGDGSPGGRRIVEADPTFLPADTTTHDLRDHCVSLLIGSGRPRW
jgi:transposase